MVVLLWLLGEDAGLMLWLVVALLLLLLLPGWVRRFPIRVKMGDVDSPKR